MVQNLEAILTELMAKRSTKSARNKSAFLTYWPQIKELCEKEWRLTDICDALRVAGVDFKYSVLWAYVDRQRKLEANAVTSGDKTEKREPQHRKQRGRRSKKQQTKVEVRTDEIPHEPPGITVSQPPQFGQKYFRSGDDFEF